MIDWVEIRVPQTVHLNGDYTYIRLSLQTFFTEKQLTVVDFQFDVIN